MDKVEQNAESFIKRLMQNPGMAPFPVLQREEQIIIFLNTNMSQLFPTLSSPNFFPGKSWQDISNILITALINVSNESLFPQLTDLLEKIDFKFTTFIRQQNFPLEKCRSQVLEFLKKILMKFDARLSFAGPFAALQYNLVDRYVEYIFNRKEYAYFELTKMQRLKMGKDEIKNYLKVVQLLRIIIHHLGISGGIDVGYSTNSGIIQRSFADKISLSLTEPLNLIPEDVIKSAIYSNLSFMENNDLPANSRIAAIFALRCKNYKPVTKLDRGADFPDKSWFNIARKNYKVHGFDIKIIDELYKIAAENGW